jgi:hypothetical protein
MVSGATGLSFSSLANFFQPKPRDLMKIRVFALSQLALVEKSA